MSRSCSNTYVLSRQFDTYCKKVMIGECRRYYSQLKRRSSKSIDDLSDVQHNALFQLDCYPSNMTRFDVHGCTCMIENDELGLALSTLNDELRSIVLLSYFEDMSDVAIANMLDLARSTVQYRRTSAIRSLQRMMGATK